MANKGEWSEPYVALRIIGDGKLYVADRNGRPNPDEWMNVLELIRHETAERIVSYRLETEDVDVDIYVNDDFVVSIPANIFLEKANILANEISSGTGASFNVAQEVEDFLRTAEILHIKARSIDKSDLFLSLVDPRSGIIRTHIGFSIKSDFGQNPTLFNTAKASGFIYEVSGMNDELADEINHLVDNHNHAAVLDRCQKIIDSGCELTFSGLPIAARAGCKAFEENLDLIDSRLVTVIERILWNHFILRDTNVDLPVVINRIIAENPCNLTRPEFKYPYMFKSFLYAAYCGMTASTLWSGNSDVNGGFIKVDKEGNVLAYYAMESDSFKTYLFDNCYLEFPATDEGHGFYANVYKENDKYYFRLNFQIRYR